jgi:hypothetical protein
MGFLRGGTALAFAADRNVFHAGGDARGLEQGRTVSAAKQKRFGLKEDDLR